MKTLSQCRIAGVDEAGRGPLAGAVFAAAVILDPQRPIAGLRDSKRLSALQRARLDCEIRLRAHAWSIAQATVQEIDAFNILGASLLAMQRAVASLSDTPDKVLVDGRQVPRLSLPCEAIVRGDACCPAISAASILAKVARDKTMIQLHHLYPLYGFIRHKGYPTVEHLRALKQYRPCLLHRRSFAPVRILLAQDHAAQT